MSPVNKQAVAAAFGRAAQSYSQHDELQRLSARGLLAALGDGRFAQVLDAGCGRAAIAVTGAQQVATSRRWIYPRRCWMKPASSSQQTVIWWPISRPSRWRMRCLTSSGAIWRCSGAPACRRPYASYTAWRGPAGGGLYHPAGKFVAGAESGVEGSGCTASCQPVSLARTGHSGAGRLALSQRGPDRHPRI